MEISWDELVVYIGGGSGAAAIIFGILKKLKIVSGLVDSFLRFSSLRFQKRMQKRLKEHPVFGIRGKIDTDVKHFLNDNRINATPKGDFIKLLMNQKTDSLLIVLLQISENAKEWSNLADASFKEYCFHKIQNMLEHEDSEVRKKLTEVYSKAQISNIFIILAQKGYFEVREEVTGLLYVNEVTRIIDGKLEINNEEKMVRIFTEIEKMFLAGFSETVKVLKKINGELDNILI